MRDEVIGFARWASQWLIPPAPAKYLKRLFPRRPVNEIHLELARLQAAPRYTRMTTNLLGHPIDFTDVHAFLPMYVEVYQHEIYKFATDSPAPLVIDAGANIGVCTRYFKDHYPDCRIIAFEPDPEIFKVLQHNVATWQLENVELHQLALWNEETELEFRAEGGDAGRLASAGEGGNIRVRTTRLRPYLEEKVALLKIDIEGAETEVLTDCADLLRNVEQIALEYHSFAEADQTLHLLLGILHDAGFRVAIQVVSVADRPLVERRVNSGFDLQMNIFGHR